jgi:hypothetical protein
MDHTYIAEHSLVERYRRGILPPAEEVAFEEHFFGCPECARELELTRCFEKGMKAMAAEDVARAAQAARLAVAAGFFAWLARRGRFAQGAIALAALVAAAAIPAAWLAARQGAVAGRGQQAASAAAYRQRWENERTRADGLRRQLAASEAARAADRGGTGRRAEASAPGASPATARPRGPGPEGSGAAAGSARAPAWTEPLVDAPLVLLGTFREQPAAGTPAIAPERAAGALTLAVDPGDDPRFTSYRLELAGPDGRTLLRRGGLHPNALETLMVTFPPGFFAPGEYSLRVFGIDAGGAAVPLGSHPFRIAPRSAAP